MLPYRVAVYVAKKIAKNHLPKFNRLRMPPFAARFSTIIPTLAQRFFNGFSTMFQHVSTTPLWNTGIPLFSLFFKSNANVRC